MVDRNPGQPCIAKQKSKMKFTSKQQSSRRNENDFWAWTQSKIVLCAIEMLIPIRSILSRIRHVPFMEHVASVTTKQLQNNAKHLRDYEKEFHVMTNQAF